MFDSLITWISLNSGLNVEILKILITLAMAVLVVAVLCAPLLLGLMPVDYFSEPRVGKSRSANQYLISALRTGLGLAIIIVGMLVFFTPIPGIVFIVLGIILCDFPGKHGLLLWLVKPPKVLKVLNWIRAKVGKQPFIQP